MFRHVAQLSWNMCMEMLDIGVCAHFSSHGSSRFLFLLLLNKETTPAPSLVKECLLSRSKINSMLTTNKYCGSKIIFLDSDPEPT
jgi:hypothetical protein